MNTAIHPANSPPPPSLLRADAAERDLDARIRQAEQRLVAREEKLRRGVSQVGTRMRRAWDPQRWGPPLAGAAAALLALRWLGRGRRAPAPAPPPAARAGGGLAHAVSMLGIVWPLLPESWRARVPPSVVNGVMGVGLPLAELLLHRRAPRAPADAERP